VVIGGRGYWPAMTFARFTAYDNDKAFTTETQRHRGDEQERLQ
jgi:hypothetical protein